MFRRNQPRRPFRRLMGALFNPNGGLAAEARQTFDEATTLYADDDFAAAAEHFAQLAELARSFNRPRRVAQLHLRAFDAWVRAGEGDKALAEARAALAIASARPRQAVRVVEAVVAELHAHGFNAQAAALGGDLRELLPAHGVRAAAAPPAPLKFPSACPQCGGRLPRSFGDDEVECDYCGAIVRGE